MYIKDLPLPLNNLLRRVYQGLTVTSKQPIKMRISRTYRYLLRPDFPLAGEAHEAVRAVPLRVFNDLCLRKRLGAALIRARYYTVGTHAFVGRLEIHLRPHTAAQVPAVCVLVWADRLVDGHSFVDVDETTTPLHVLAVACRYFRLLLFLLCSRYEISSNQSIKSIASNQSNCTEVRI